MKTRFLIAFLVFCTASAGAEIAVVPYKIDAPSAEFPAALGAEYARLMAVAAAVSRGIDVHNPKDLEADLVRNKLDPAGTITPAELDSLGRSRLLDAFLVGTLYAAKGHYISESVLYSVKDGKVVARTRAKARTLVGLAEAEIARVFPGDAGPRRASGPGKMDLAFVIDTSYNVKRDRASLHRGIKALAREVSDDWGGEARVSIVPFPSGPGLERSALSIKSALELSKALDALVPGGGNDAKSIEKALSDAVNNVPWRSGATKLMVIVAATPFPRSTRFQHYAHFAKRKGIMVCTVALGDVTGEGRDYLAELSRVGGGFHADAAYHRKVFDARGSGTDLYLEAGRLFTSTAYDRRWRDGLFRPERRGSLRAKGREFLKEVFFDEKKYPIGPGSMEKVFAAVSSKEIINTGGLECNAADLLGSFPEKYFSMPGRGAARTIGRALVYQGRTSIWIDIIDGNDLAFFREKAKDGTVFPLGVSVQRKKDLPYGFRFNPQSYVRNLSADYIPALLKVDLETLIKKSSYYANNGLFTPPVWFLDLKVERVKFKKEDRDVRD